jgi:hypothetical protein
VLTNSVIEGSNILTATYDGSLGADEMVALRERLATLIRQRGSARLLVEYGHVDLGRVEPRAMWEDLKTAGLLKDVTKVAILADQGWIETVASAVGTVLPLEVRSFHRDQHDEALAWLYAPEASPRDVSGDRADGEQGGRHRARPHRSTDSSDG